MRPMGVKDEYGVRQVIGVHIRPALGDLEIANLTSRKLRDWHHGLASRPSPAQDVQVLQYAEYPGNSPRR